MIANNAQVWPPALLAFSPSLNKTTCSEKIIEYNMLGVGQNSTTKEATTSLCLSNSAIGLMWSPPEIFNGSKISSIILEAKITKHRLDLWYNMTA